VVLVSGYLEGLLLHVGLVKELCDAGVVPFVNALEGLYCLLKLSAGNGRLKLCDLVEYFKTYNL